jgi:cGMP-dependent protein kinase
MKLYQLEDEIEREREISLEIDHAFIKKLITTYKDIKRIYFLSEFLSNISLSDVMKELNDMPLHSIKFYIACTILFLEYMHKRDIVYRRLNPKNISIDEEGYPKFINLSSAKKIKGRTYTMIETLPHYLAPEVILGKGYGLSVDYWSLGVMMYELLYKIMPFGDDETDIYRLYKIILNGNLRFPQTSDNKGEIKDLIIQLLNKNPAVRLGGSFKDIKNHPWFIEINWKQLLNKDINAPYLPDFSEVASKVEEALENRYSLEQAIIAAENLELE